MSPYYCSMSLYFSLWASVLRVCEQAFDLRAGDTQLLAYFPHALPLTIQLLCDAPLFVSSREVTPGGVSPPRPFSFAPYVPDPALFWSPLR
jgi:hypothetical protein